MKDNTVTPVPAPIQPVAEIVTPNPAENEFDFQGRFLSPKELLVMAWGIYKSHFWKLLLAFLIPGAIIIATAVISTVLTKTDIYSSDPKTLLIIPVFMIVMAIIIPLQSLGMLYLIDGIKRGTGIKEAYGKAWKKIFPYWKLIWLQGLIVVGAYIPLIIPGIILSVAFMLSLYVLVFEDTGGLDAMLKSREYIRGKWRAVVWRQAYPTLIMIAILIPVMIIFGILTGGNEEAEKFVESITNLIMLPLSPLLIVYAYLTYRNLKAIAPSSENKPVKKFGWYMLGVWGVVSQILIAALAIYIFIKVLSNLDDKTSDARTVFNMVNTRAEIQLALGDYQEDNGVFPYKLSELIPDYMKEEQFTLLEDAYSYKLLDDGTSYEFCLNFSDSENDCVTEKSNLE